ncbi:MAG: hypothetical protein AB7P03_17735 [Kofleriaceae bacterium]
MEAPARTTPRFWMAVQPSIVRLYKVAGLVALTSILVGLLGFLVVNVYYFFDHTWVRPVVLSATHQKVVEASTQLADARLRAGQLLTETSEVEAQLAEIDRMIAMSDKFIADAGTSAGMPQTPEQWLLHRELERAKLDRDNAAGRRVPLMQRLDTLKLRQADQEALVQRLAASPYVRAVNQKVVLVFVPYQNLKNVKIGTKLYGCSWGLIACSNVGKVTTILDGEVQDVHPHDESIQRGVMLEVEISTAAAGQSVLFAGSKPLWLF